jgi:hypothetical protein
MTASMTTGTTTPSTDLTFRSAAWRGSWPGAARVRPHSAGISQPYLFRLFPAKKAAIPRKQPLDCDNAVRGCSSLGPGIGGEMPLKAGAGRWSRDICELQPGLFQQVAR